MLSLAELVITFTIKPCSKMKIMFFAILCNFLWGVITKNTKFDSKIDFPKFFKK